MNEKLILRTVPVPITFTDAYNNGLKSLKHVKFQFNANNGVIITIDIFKGGLYIDELEILHFTIACF